MFDRGGGFGRAGGATLKEMSASAMDVRSGKMSLDDYSSRYGSRMSLNEGMLALASYNEAVYQNLLKKSTYVASAGKFFHPSSAMLIVFAKFIRETAVILAPGAPLGFVYNPLHKAEAVYMDAGWSFIGGEGDKGGFMILTGEQIGEIHPFVEGTHEAFGIDIGLGMEIGRVDLDGRPESSFTSEDFYGYRSKVSVSYSFTMVGPPLGFSVGGARAWSTPDGGGSVTATSVQFGPSLGLPWGFHFNRGEITKPK
jgi:hypothetical protein